MDLGHTRLTGLVSDSGRRICFASYACNEVKIMFDNITRDTTYFDLNVGTIECRTDDMDFLTTSSEALVIVHCLDSRVNSHDPAVIACEVTMSI